MRFLLDQNVSPNVTRYLKEQGHDAVDTRELGITEASDEDLWSLAAREKRFLLTFDLDFSDIRTYPPGPQWGIMVFRTRSTTGATVIKLLQAILLKYSEKKLRGKLLIVTESQVRIRRP